MMRIFTLVVLVILVGPSAWAERATGWKTPEEMGATEKPARRCRVANQPYNLDDMKLPICPSKKKAVASGWRTPASESPAEPVGESAPPPALSFEKYLQNNSRHPALSGRVEDRQRAFQEVARTAVMTMPDSEDSHSATAPAGSAPPAGQSPHTAPASPHTASPNGTSQPTPFPY